MLSIFFFDQYMSRNNQRSIYYRIPIRFLDEFRQAMAYHGKYYKVRYRGPRFNVPSAAYRGTISKQTTCLKQDATHFSVYQY